MEKKLYLVNTTNNDRWEILCGNYLILAHSEDEIRNMKFDPIVKEILGIKLIEESIFTNGVFEINQSVTE
jgi:hypothetical protein